jgi:hypothetical protein
MSVSVNDAARTRRTTYVVLAVVFLLLAGVVLFAYGTSKSTSQAEQKADQFVAELAAAGLRTPSKEQVVQILGDDGGATCANPNSALKRGMLLGELTNGAAGPGIRPIIADNKVVQGQLLIIKVYCPIEAEEFAKFVENLRYGPVITG